MISLRIIGVTGPIGSGKSMVSRILRDLGAVIIDADVIARTVTSKGSEALVELVSYFGEDILDQNGELNRKKLAAMAFNDPVKLHALNSITHKHIIRKIRSGIENIKTSGKSEVVVVDAAIPVEHGFLDIVDEVWIVFAEREKRIRRIMERSGYTYEEAMERINSQIRDDEYLSIDGKVLENDGTIEELEKAVVKLFIHKKEDDIQLERKQ